MSKPSHFHLNRMFRGGVVLALLTACTATPAPTPTASVPPATATPTRLVTAVPTIAPSATLLPTITPTQVLVVRDALSGTDERLYVRNEPSTMASIFRTINDNDWLEIIGRTEDNRWLQVQFIDDATGWIMSRATNASAAFDALPVTGTADNIDFVGLTRAETTMHAQPSSAVSQVAALNPLTPLRLDARNADATWLRGTTEDNQQGWVQTAAVAVNFDLSLLTALEARATVLETAGGLRLRARPTDQGFILRNLPPLMELTVVGRTADDAWLRVRTPEGNEGWVTARLVTISGTLEAVPVITP